MKRTKVFLILFLALTLLNVAVADWVTSGSNMYSGTSGNVGIGTTNPQAKLSVGGDGVPDTGVFGNGSNYGGYFFGASSTGVYGRGSNYGGYFEAGENGWGTYSKAPGPNGRGICGEALHESGFGGYFLGRGYFSKNVGIGTTNPPSTLHVDTDSFNRARITVSNGGDLYGAAISGSSRGHCFFGSNLYLDQTANLKTIGSHPNLGFSGMHAAWGHLKFYAQATTSTTADATVSPDVRMIIDGDTGNTGVGTTSPEAKLHVETDRRDGKAVYGHANYSTRDNDYAGAKNYGGYFVAEGPASPMGLGYGPGGTGIYAKGSFLAGDFDGPVRINGNASIIGDVTIFKRVSSGGTSILMTLGEGLDYAEGFPVSEERRANPGCVLVIDAKNPGKLRLSDEAYDTKVAGIAAGGNGLGSGVRLGGEEFDCDVALAGRVYCNVDATHAGVEPGDLLTTASTPGYAMKVLDHTRAQGAILGKAMEKLEHGKKGQILVLVTLQ
jgi:hypothetical protein